MHIPKWLSVTLSFLLLTLILVAYPLTHHKEKTEDRKDPVVVVTSTPDFSHHLTIGSTIISVAIADTDASREQGLSGTAPLTSEQGMLFVFDTPDNTAFWMKDMNYSLDIVWIDANKKVVSVSKNLSPSTYPDTFSPGVPVQYVLEVPAGFADAHGIKARDSVSF